MKSRLLRISLCLLVLLMVSISVALPVYAQDLPRFGAAWVLGPTMSGQPDVSFQNLDRNTTSTIYDRDRSMYLMIETPSGLSNITADCIIYYPPSHILSNWAFQRVNLGNSGTHRVQFNFKPGDPYGKYAFRVGIWGTDTSGIRRWSESIGFVEYTQYTAPPIVEPPKTDPLLYVLIGLLVVIVAAALIIFFTRRQPAPVAPAPYRPGGYTQVPTTPTPTPPGTSRGTAPYPPGGTGTGTRLAARVLLPDNSEVPLTGPVTTLGRSNFARALTPNQASVVSKQHCQISYEGGRYFIQDTSLNGTKVNGMDIRGRGKVELTDGAQVTLADALTFTFRSMR